MCDWGRWGCVIGAGGDVRLGQVGMCDWGRWGCAIGAGGDV